MPRFTVDQDKALKLAAAFAAASATADTKALSELLAEDAILVSDGGGKRTAALRIMVGREDVMGLIRGIVWRHGDMGIKSVEAVRINGYPGLLVQLADGPETFALEPGEDGKIAAVYVMRNPDKLRHVG